MPKPAAAAPLIVALDVGSLKEAALLVSLLKGRIRYFKIGLQLFTTAGPQAIELVKKAGGEVFLDLKYHDIPNTVGGACRSATELGVWMISLHCAGGEEMLRRGVDVASEATTRSGRFRPLLVGITILTSQSQGSVSDVVMMASVGKKAGLDGVVCSPREIADVRRAVGPGFLIVTPGIRPTGAGVPSDDQKRTATAAEASALGADFLVVGRPILESPDPLKTVDQILSSIS